MCLDEYNYFNFLDNMITTIKSLIKCLIKIIVMIFEQKIEKKETWVWFYCSSVKVLTKRFVEVILFCVSFNKSDNKNKVLYFFSINAYKFNFSTHILVKLL